MTKRRYPRAFVDAGAEYEKKNAVSLMMPAWLPVQRFSPYQMHHGFLSRSKCRELVAASGKHLEHADWSEYGQKGNVWQTGLDRVASTEWLYEKISRLFEKVNDTYRFSLWGIVEPMRIVFYREGNFNDWHQDYGVQDRSKLSMTVLLAAPVAGGVLEFQNFPRVDLAVGDAIVYPSFIPHRVAPVISGTRVSLVGWSAGPAFV